jgi:AmmeMemoRadiSam system protein B
MVTTRPAAVAGRFYPAEAKELEGLVSELLSGPPESGPRPRALIVPHAAYEYSGAVAASGYRLIRPVSGVGARVVVVGPSHRFPLDGVAVPGADRFRTPLGDVPIDAELRALALRHPSCVLSEEPHRHEHSLEVQLPFLQFQLGAFSLLPIAFGRISVTDLADLLDALWETQETLIVVSSDLSHYHDYETARELDSNTAEAILALDPDRLGEGSACGLTAIKGLIELARRNPLRVAQLGLANSGDTAGPRDEVVGYGAFGFWDCPKH